MEGLFLGSFDGLRRGSFDGLLRGSFDGLRRGSFDGLLRSLSSPNSELSLLSVFSSISFEPCLLRVLARLFSRLSTVATLPTLFKEASRLRLFFEKSAGSVSRFGLCASNDLASSITRLGLEPVEEPYARLRMR